MQRKSIKVATMSFPFKGMDCAAPLARMPEGTATLLQNIFPQAQRTGASDQSMLRYTGGKRPALYAPYTFSTPTVAAGTSIVGLYLWRASGPFDTKTFLVVIAGSAGGSTDLVVYTKDYSSGTVLTALSGFAQTALSLPTFAAIGNKLFVASPTGGSNVFVLTYSSGAITVSTSIVSLPAGQSNISLVSGISTVDLFCRYRARLCVAGSRQSLFAMSAVGDGTDFDFAGTATSSAYKGSVTGFAGVPGDRITCIVALNDDYMLFGCESSLWRMVGDPRLGGRVYQLSDVVGVVGRRSWCFDEGGTFWFLGSNGGLYKLQGDRPVEVMHGRMTPYLQDVVRQNPVSGYLWQMEYDRARRMIYIWNTIAATGTIVGYSVDLDAPFLVALGVSPYVKPYSMLGTDEGQLFMGGTGGLCALQAASVAGGDTPFAGGTATAIDCLVRWAPIVPDGGQSEWMARELAASGAVGCGAASFYMLGARSAEEVQALTYSSDYYATGSLFSSAGGFQAPVGLRNTAAAHQLALRQNSSSLDLRLDRFDLTLERRSRRRYGV